MAGAAESFFDVLMKPKDSKEEHQEPPQKRPSRKNLLEGKQLELQCQLLPNALSSKPRIPFVLTKPKRTPKLLAPGIFHFPQLLSKAQQEALVRLVDEDVCGWSGGKAKWPARIREASSRGDMRCFMNMYTASCGRQWSYSKKDSSEKSRLADVKDVAPLPDSLAKAYAFVVDMCGFEFFESLECTMAFANFYPRGWGKLGWHADLDASRANQRRGDPVVSLSVGDSGVFDIEIPAELKTMDPEEALQQGRGLTCVRKKGKQKTIIIESGDAIVFGGASRLMRHRVRGLKKRTSSSLPIIPGRLNVTLRSWGQ